MTSAALLAAVVILWTLRDLLLLLFAAVVLSVALCRVVKAVSHRLPLGRIQALLLSLIVFIGLLAITAAVVIPPFISEFAQLLTKLPAAAATALNLLLGAVERLSGALYGADSALDLGGQGWAAIQRLPSSPALASGVGKGFLGLLGLAGNTGTGILQLLFVLAVALMLAVQPSAYQDACLQLVPSFYRRKARRVVLRCDEALASWMVGVLISSTAVFGLCAIGLSLLGVKLVLANALLAGVLNVIPNVGPTLGTVFPVAMALLDAPWKAAAVVALYVLIQNLESYVITPSVMHHQLQLLPALTLAAQVLFTLLFGPLGLLLALPLAVVLQVLIRDVLVHDVLDRWPAGVRQR